MLVAFFESIRYVGHLLPVAFVRIFLGYYYFQDSLQKFHGDFLSRPRLAEQISEWLPQSQAPHWYKLAISGYLISQWKTLAFIVLGLQLAVGISYIIGYVVRPMAIIGVFLSFNMIYCASPQYQDFFRILLGVHLMMAWVGSGRCLGFDYYFYKRRRGFWW